MNENPIQITDGKVIGDSTFFMIANDLLEKEVERLCDMTRSLDQDPARKRENIAEYKCIKFRYAVVSLVQITLSNTNRLRKMKDLASTHFLPPPYDELFKTKAEYLAGYDSAPVLEKPDYSLYYVMLIFVGRELEKVEAKLQNATDWEKIELQERIDGLRFAEECLHEGWRGRKDVTA